MTEHEAALDQALGRVQSRWALRDWTLTVARCVLVLVPLCLILGWLDYRWDFSATTRLIELIGLVATIIWMAWRWLIPTVSQRRDTYAAALRVESVFGQFGGRMVSRVEFRSETGSPPGVSAELVDAACNRIERAAAGVPMADAIDVRPVRVPATVALVLLILLSWTVKVQPTLACRWVERTLLPFGSAVWSRRTEIEDLEKSYRIRRGDSITVTGRITGEIPVWRSGELEWRAAESRGTFFSDANVLTFDIADDGAFTATVGPLLEPIELSIEAGDARVEGIAVDVVVPPELASIEAVYNYPEFTGRQPDRVQSGDVRALVGTEIELAIRADRPVERVDLAFSDDKGERVVSAQLDSEVQAKSSFVVSGRGRYQVRLFDEYGFTSDTPATFVIDPIDNELPVIKITRPGLEHRVTPMTRLRLAFEATDDFGVVAATVRWKTKSAATTQPALTQGSAAIPVSRPLAEWTDTFVWDLAIANLQPDDVVEYHVEVRDAGEHLTDDKVGVSARHVLKVVTPETLSQSLDARLREAFGELDYLTRQQAAGLDEVTASIVALPTGGDPVLPADLRGVQVEVNRQVRIRRQIDRLSRRMGDVADDLQDSFLAEAGRIADLHTLSKGLAELAAGEMQQVSDKLRQAQTQLREVLAGGAVK